MPISLWLPSLYFGLSTSLIFGASSANWFSLLVSMELNLIMILPILFYSSNLISSEGVITYLLAQSAGSLMILLCLLVEPPMILVVHNLDLLLLSGIVLKLGVCPLHFWFLSIVSFSNSLNFFLLSTTQKFLPLLMLMNLEMDGFFLLLVLTGCLVPVINLMSNKVKAMLAYSSVFQMVMLIVAIQISNKTGLFYYATYCLTLVPVCYWLITKNEKGFISSMTETSYKHQALISMAMIMGLPPFTMFLPKLYLLVNTEALLTVVVVLFLVLVINMFIYLRLISQVSLLSGSLMNMNTTSKGNIGALIGMNLFPWLLLV